MWYIFSIFGGYIAASFFYQSVAKKFGVQPPYKLWSAILLIVWIAAGFIWQHGPERGIPFFLVIMAVAGPLVLVSEYWLAGHWSRFVTWGGVATLVLGVVATAGMGVLS